MGKRIISFMVLMVVMVSLVGCSQQGKSHKVDDVKTKTGELQEKQEMITGLQNKHNEYNAYRICDENENAIQQLDLEGNPIQTFEITKGQDGTTLLRIAYVTNDEIMYILEKDNQCELWTIPLLQNDNKDEVQTGKQQFLFGTKDIMEVLYADANYIAYKDNLNYTEFDRTRQKKILVDANSKSSSYCQPNNFNIQTAGAEKGNADGTILLAKNVGENQYPKNIYVHTVGSGKVNKIADTYLSKNGTINMVSFDGKIYYTGLIKNWKNEKQSWDVWCYDCKMQSNDCAVQEKQIKDKISFSQIDALFINDNELWLETGNEKQKFLYASIASDGSSLDSGITEAMKLNRYLDSLNSDDMDLTIVTISNDQCVIMGSNASECQFYCYDIKKEQECWR